MPRHCQQDSWDAGTNTPSIYFVYEFDSYRFLLNKCCSFGLTFAADRTVPFGSVENLPEAVFEGCPIRLSIRGLCLDVAYNPTMGLTTKCF